MEVVGNGVYEFGIGGKVVGKNSADTAVTDSRAIVKYTVVSNDTTVRFNGDADSFKRISVERIVINLTTVASAGVLEQYTTTCIISYNIVFLEIQDCFIKYYI